MAWFLEGRNMLPMSFAGKPLTCHFASSLRLPSPCSMPTISYDMQAFQNITRASAFTTMFSLVFSPSSSLLLCFSLTHFEPMCVTLSDCSPCFVTIPCRHVIEFLTLINMDSVPSHIAEIARAHEDVTIMFMDIVGELISIRSLTGTLIS